MNKNSVTNTMLQEGVDFTLTVTKPSFWHKIKLQKTYRRFVIYPICLGTLLKIAELINDIDSFEYDEKNFLEDAITKIVKYSGRFAEIIALAIINKPFSENSLIRIMQRKQFKRLIRFINGNINQREAMKLLGIVIQQMDIQHFFALMVSMNKMKVMENPVGTEEKSITSGD